MPSDNAFKSDRSDASDEPLLVALGVSPDGSGTYSSIAPDDFLQSLTVALPSDGVWEGEIALFDGMADFLESLASHISFSSYFSIKFGRRGAWSESSPPEFVMRVTDAHYSSNAAGFGTTYSLLGAAGDGLRDKAPQHAQGYAAGTNPLTIFESIRKFAGWTAGIIDTDCADGITNAITWNPDVPAVAFASQLASVTRARRGNSPYRFYLGPGGPDGVANFVTLQTAGQTRTHKYAYGRRVKSDCIDVQVDDRALWASYVASVGTAAEFNAKVTSDGASVRIERDAGYTADGKSSAPLPAAPRLPAAPSTLQDSRRRYSLGAYTTRALLEADLGKLYESIRQQTVFISLQVRGTHDVRPMDYIDFEYVPITVRQTAHFLTNWYRVLTVTHSFAAGQWVTTLNAYSEALSRLDPSAATAANAVATRTP